jgi:hypothetical protein
MQGSLQEFRLAEILQLVAVQQKSGLLRLTRGTSVVTFYFDDGILVSTRDRRHASYDPFLDYLKSVGWLHPETASFLATRIESSREDLVNILVGDRYMTEEEVRTALEDLAQELVQKTFGWRDGTYQFIAGDEALAGLQHRLALKIDGILMEGARRADEWPRLLEKLPGPETIVDLAVSPGTALGERARHVVDQIQGPTRIGELLRRSRVSEYETYEAILHAVEAGFVRVLERPDAAPAGHEDAHVGPRGAARAPVRSNLRVLWTLPRPLGWMLALLVSFASLLGTWFVLPHLASEPARRAAIELEMETARAAVRDGIEVYRALHGRYPASLTALAQDELASAELLRRAGPLRYEIATDGSGFALSPAAGAGGTAR